MTSSTELNIEGADLATLLKHREMYSKSVTAIDAELARRAKAIEDAIGRKRKPRDKTPKPTKP